MLFARNCPLQDAVSTDFVGTRHAGIVDAPATLLNNDLLTLHVWYDNEMGYSAQVVRLLQKISGIVLPTFPLPKVM